MSDSMLKRVLQQIVNNHDKGLCIVDLPTGSGKSYTAKNILYDALLDTSDNRKYICITSAKKNKLYDELNDMCITEESKALFNRQVIDLQANKDMISSTFGSINIEDIKDEDIRTKLDKLDIELKKDKILKENARNNKDQQNFLPILLDNHKAIEQIERELRKAIHGYLKEKYRSYSRKTIIEMLKEEGNEDHWIIKAFPGMLIKEKKIIFMTVAKFIYPFDSIVETPFYFYNDDDFKNCVFYIDEFDQAKGSMLKQIISRDLSRFDSSINLLGLFDNILQSTNRGLENLPSELFKASENERKRGFDDASLRNLFENISRIAKDISDEYSLFYELKSKDVDDENSDFLFHDTTITKSIGKNNHDAYVVANKNDKTNYIQRSGKDKLKLENILKRIEGFTSFFMRSCYTYAINLRENQIERGNNFYDLSDAINSVTSSFRINEPYSSFIHDQVLYGGQARKKNTIDSIGDSFYENGFSLFTIEDSSSHSMNSIVKMEVHNDTPEKILLKMSRQGLTIGLSATGTVETNIGNFDLLALENELAEDFIHIDADDFELIKKEYEESVADQAGMYRVSFTDQYTKETELDCYIRIFEEVNADEEYVKEFFNQIKNQVPQFEKRKHIYNLIWAFDRFLFNEDMLSYLCLLNTYLKKGGVLDFAKILLNELIAKYVEAGYSQYEDKTTDDLFYLLDGEDFDRKKDNLLDRLGKGEKIFVLSTFQALATGQNLQYPAPISLIDEGKLIRTNDRPNDESKKDFDGVFVEKPTNVLVNLSNPSELEKEQKIEAMYQAEELKASGEISAKTCLAVLNRAAGSGSKYEDLYAKESVRNTQAITIIQAIGRIDRTNLKSRNIHVDAEYDAIGSFSSSMLNSSRLIAPVIKALYAAVRTKKAEETEVEDKRVVNRAIEKANVLGNNIYKIMNGGSGWTEENIEKWETMNEELLKDPQGLKTNKNNNLYIEMPKESDKYFYKQSGDFRTNEISFNPVFESGWNEVSEKGLRLDAIMAIPEIRKLFEEKGYATKFVPSKRMPAPVIANNLLKGRYGEIAGKYLIETYTGLKLEKIEDPALYEKFDFQMNNCKVVVDFKNWSQMTSFDDEEYTEKMIGKAKECGSKLVLAVNLISEEVYRPVEKDIDGIHFAEISNLIIADKNGYRINHDVISKTGELIRRYL